MDVKEIYNLIKDVKPGVWKIGVTYKKNLPIAKNKFAAASGYVEGDIYKVVFRWCSANVNKKNTKAYQDARAASQAKAAEQGKEWTPRKSGFHDSKDANELNIIEYSDNDNKPCLILKKGPNADKVQYFAKGKEISLDDIKQLIEDRVLNKSVLNELPANAVFNLYPEKVQSLKIDGQLHEELNRFDGIELPDEDGITEELDNIEADYDINKYYSDKDKDILHDEDKLDECGINESLNKKPSKRITEAMEHEARKYGYKNYKEYERANR